MRISEMIRQGAIREAAPKSKHIPGAPADIDKYYEACIKRYKGKKEYCARTAWQIYCMHVNPKWKGCTEFGKTKGPPYSSPISK